MPGVVILILNVLKKAGTECLFIWCYIMKSKNGKYFVGTSAPEKSNSGVFFNFLKLNLWYFSFKSFLSALILIIIILFSVISCGCTGDEPDTGKGSDVCRDYSGVCSCAGDCYDCQDFDSKSDAQKCYDYCMSIGKGDVHSIDKDSDGVACNSVLEEDTPVREEPDYRNPDSVTKHDVSGES